MSTPSPTPPSDQHGSSAQPYGTPPPAGYVPPAGYPVAGQPQAGAPATRNTAGTVSLVFAIAVIVWLYANMILQAQAIANGGVDALAAIGIVSTFVNMVLALGAIGFGIAGILSRSTKKVVAGIGTGVGAMALAGAISGLLYPVLYGLLGS